MATLTTIWPVPSSWLVTSITWVLLISTIKIFTTTTPKPLLDSQKFRVSISRTRMTKNRVFRLRCCLLSREKCNCHHHVPCKLETGWTSEISFQISSSSLPISGNTSKWLQSISRVWAIRELHSSIHRCQQYHKYRSSTLPYNHLAFQAIHLKTKITKSKTGHHRNQINGIAITPLIQWKKLWHLFTIYSLFLRLQSLLTLNWVWDIRTPIIHMSRRNREIAYEPAFLKKIIIPTVIFDPRQVPFERKIPPCPSKKWISRSMLVCHCWQVWTSQSQIK